MAFAYKLEQEDGTPADPPTVRTAAPTRPGDTIPLGRDRTLRVVRIRDDDADQAPTLVVEELPPAWLDYWPACECCKRPKHLLEVWAAVST